MESQTILIPQRFCGPPTSGNGGYTCGLIARALKATSAEVTLRKPIPINRPLKIVIEGGAARLLDGEELIAEGELAEWEPDVVPIVTFEEAQSASAKSPAFKDHPFPTCYVCGPDRDDGLGIFPGPVERLSQQGAFAAPWVPHREQAGEAGTVRNEIIWAALDCPTGFAGGFPADGTLVTGRLAVQLYLAVMAEEKCVLVSWPRGIEGRKHLSDGALLGADGAVKAVARATWIKL